MRKVEHPSDVSPEFLRVCLAVSAALAAQCDSMDNSLEDIDLFGGPAEDWNRRRDQLNEALDQMRDFKSRTAPEFSAKMDSFNEAKDVLGQDDPRIVECAFSLLQEAPSFVQRQSPDLSNGLNGHHGRPIMSFSQRSIQLPRPYFAGILRWSRRSQGSE